MPFGQGIRYGQDDSGRRWVERRIDGEWVRLPGNLPADPPAVAVDTFTRADGALNAVANDMRRIGDTFAGLTDAFTAWNVAVPLDWQGNTAYVRTASLDPYFDCSCPTCEETRSYARLSPAEREAREAERRERKRLRLERQARAKQRALDLLRSLLDEKQRRSFNDRGWFEVVGSAGTTFQVESAYSGNVWVLRDGQNTGALCAHPRTDTKDEEGEGVQLPLGDSLIGQLLMLRADEPAFWRVAVFYHPHSYLHVRKAEVLGTTTPVGPWPGYDDAVQIQGFFGDDPPVRFERLDGGIGWYRYPERQYPRVEMREWINTD